MLKSQFRKKIIKIRKKFHKENIQINFDQVFKLLKKERVTNKVIGGYFPVNFEVDDLKLLKKFEINKFKISLPVIKKNFQMDFFNWSTKDPLNINKYGIPEPISNKVQYPDILLVPIVAYDENLNRVGYGGGFYDRYINKIKKYKKVVTIGLAYSFQMVKKISTNKYDIKLDFIITEKQMIK